MTIVESIQFFVALNILIIGLSHLFQPKIWIEFFQYLHQKGNVGNILNALIALSMGTFIVAFHSVWEWPMILVTLYGITQLIKGFLYLMIPSVGLKSIGRVDEKTDKFRWVGLVMSLLGLLLLFNCYKIGILI